MLDGYTYKYGSGGCNLKGLEWHNFNRNVGSGLLPSVQTVTI